MPDPTTPARPAPAPDDAAAHAAGVDAVLAWLDGLERPLVRAPGQSMTHAALDYLGNAPRDAAATIRRALAAAEARAAAAEPPMASPDAVLPSAVYHHILHNPWMHAAYTLGKQEGAALRPARDGATEVGGCCSDLPSHHDACPNRPLPPHPVRPHTPGGGPPVRPDGSPLPLPPYKD
jgi:hypothetical protein